MNPYAEFMRTKAQILADRPATRDFALTDITQAFPDVCKGLRIPEIAYRCDLVRRWLACFGLERIAPEQVLASQGVRASLALLFESYAAQAKRALLPSDVYPVYQHLAERAGLAFATYTTVPETLPSVLTSHDLLLIANPTKPRGTTLSAAEVEAIETWLAGDVHRRVIVDAVYTFGRGFDSATLRLLASGQAIVLHSLSKSWAMPLHFGVAVVPQSDVAALRAVFAAQRPDRSRLALAQALLEQRPDLPLDLGRRLGRMESAMREELRDRGIPVGTTNTPGYHLLVPQDWRALLEARNLLGLPAHVFGMQGNWTVLSLLRLSHNA